MIAVHQKEKKLYQYFDFQSTYQSKLVMEKLMNLILRIINKQKCHFKNTLVQCVPR